MACCILGAAHNNDQLDGATGCVCVRSHSLRIQLPTLMPSRDNAPAPLHIDRLNQATHMADPSGAHSVSDAHESLKPREKEFVTFCESINVASLALFHHGNTARSH